MIRISFVTLCRGTPHDAPRSSFLPSSQIDPPRLILRCRFSRHAVHCPHYRQCTFTLQGCALYLLVAHLCLQCALCRLPTTTKRKRVAASLRLLFGKRVAPLYFCCAIWYPSVHTASNAPVCYACHTVTTTKCMQPCCKRKRATVCVCAYVVVCANCNTKFSVYVCHIITLYARCAPRGAHRMPHCAYLLARRSNQLNTPIRHTASAHDTTPLR